MIRLLVNCSTLVEGGGVQVGISVVEHFMRSKNFDAFFVLSSAIASQLNLQQISANRILITKSSPAKLLNFRIKLEIKKIENVFQPDLVYSVGFPSYVSFHQVELGRYTNPWALVNCSQALKQLSIFNKLKVSLRARYRNFYARNAGYFETQTDIAAEGIERRLKVSSNAIKVIPNSINDLYYKAEKVLKKNDKTFNILYICSPHIHKNINIIPDVAKDFKLLIPEKEFRFFLTLPKNSPQIKKLYKNAKKKCVQDSIYNLGKLSVKECVDAYSSADICFMPSLLEVFSASYLEAMQMSVPILASDLDFAREICGEAAIYFNPLSSKDAASKIEELINDNSLNSRLVSNGKERLKKYPQNKLKFELLDQFISKIVKETKLS